MFRFDPVFGNSTSTGFVVGGVGGGPAATDEGVDSGTVDVVATVVGVDVEDGAAVVVGAAVVEVVAGSVVVGGAVVVGTGAVVVDAGIVVVEVVEVVVVVDGSGSVVVVVVLVVVVGSVQPSGRFTVAVRAAWLLFDQRAVTDSDADASP